MKKQLISVFLCLLSFSGVKAQQDNKFDLNFENVPLQQVIDHLDDVSGYSFSYSSSSIPMDTRISVKTTESTLWKSLDAALQFLPITYQVFDRNIVLEFNQLHQTVRGTVVDKDTQQPIFGATAMLVGSQPLLGATTGMEGKFKIESAPVGRHLVKVNYLGYEEQIAPILLGSGKEVVLEVELVESIVKMDEVVIEATGVGYQPINEMAQVSGRSFTVEETKRYAVGLGDPLRLASSFAGVMNADDGANEIIIRGNTPRGILWKLEGVEIPSPNHFSTEGASTGGVSMLSTQVMSRSDFYSGAFAPEYSNALSGVFDIHLRKGNNEKHEKTIQAGFLGINTAMEGPLGNNGGSYLFNYRYSTLSILTNIGVISEGGGSNIFQDLSFNINKPTNNLGTFSLFGLGGLSGFKDVEGEFVDHENYDLGVVGLKHQYVFDNNTFLKTTLSWSGTNIKDDFVDAGNTIQYTSFKKNYWRGSVLLNKKIDAQHLLETGITLSRFKFSFDETDIDYGQDGDALPIRVLFNDHGYTSTQQGFASWQYRVSEALTLVNGFHIFRYAMNGETTFEPRSSLKWKLNPLQSISIGYGRHSRMESLEYYLGNGFDSNSNIVDYNRNLKVTKSRHFVASYDYALSANLYFKVETYYQKLFDIPVLAFEDYRWYSTINESDGYVNVPLVNEGTGRNVGVEISLDKKFANDHYFMTNVSIFDSKYKGMDGISRNTRFNGNYTVNALGGKEWKVGRNNKNNVFGLSFKASASGNQRYIPIDLATTLANNQFTLDLDHIYTQNLPSYFRMDLQFSYRKNKPKHTSEWRLDIQNITNRRNAITQILQNRQVRFDDSGLGLIPVLSYRVEF